MNCGSVDLISGVGTGIGELNVTPNFCWLIAIVPAAWASQPDLICSSPSDLSCPRIVLSPVLFAVMWPPHVPVSHRGKPAPSRLSSLGVPTECTGSGFAVAAVCASSTTRIGVSPSAPSMYSVSSSKLLLAMLLHLACTSVLSHIADMVRWPMSIENRPHGDCECGIYLARIVVLVVSCLRCVCTIAVAAADGATVDDLVLISVCPWTWLYG
jgi:hypothetical protein